MCSILQTLGNVYSEIILALEGVGVESLTTSILHKHYCEDWLKNSSRY